MEQQNSTKRPAKIFDENNFWDCSVCTYRNSAEAYKCLMCDIRKGTSTRKPKLNSHLVAQVAQQFTAQQSKVNPNRRDELNKDEEIKKSEDSDSSVDKDDTTVKESNFVNQTEADAPKSTESEKEDDASNDSVKNESNNVVSSANGKRSAAIDVCRRSKKRLRLFRRKSQFKNVDRSRSTSCDITVNNVTVTITEYPLKRPEDMNDDSSSSSDTSTPSSSSSDTYESSLAERDSDFTSDSKSSNGII